MNPNDAADRNLKNTEGYTNLEIYINILVDYIIVNQNEGGEASGYGSEISGNRHPNFNPDESKTPVNVYGLDGKTIRSQVEPNIETEGLPNGIYIVGKKKISVNN